MDPCSSIKTAMKLREIFKYFSDSRPFFFLPESSEHLYLKPTIESSCEITDGHRTEPTQRDVCPTCHLSRSAFYPTQKYYKIEDDRSLSI